MSSPRAPSPEPRAPSVPRHFEEDFEFPEHCDHCPREFAAGTEYQRVQFVVDGENSFVGRERRVVVEHSFELVLCVPCATRLGTWIRTPLSVLGEAADAPAELDDGELEEALEKELFILGDGEEGLLAPGLLASSSGSGSKASKLVPSKLGASFGSDYDEEKIP